MRYLAFKLLQFAICALQRGEGVIRLPIIEENIRSLRLRKRPRGWRKARGRSNIMAQARLRTQGIDNEAGVDALTTRLGLGLRTRTLLFAMFKLKEPYTTTT